MIVCSATPRSADQSCSNIFVVQQKFLYISVYRSRVASHHGGCRNVAFVERSCSIENLFNVRRSQELAQGDNYTLTIIRLLTNVVSGVRHSCRIWFSVHVSLYHPLFAIRGVSGVVGNSLI